MVIGMKTFQHNLMIWSKRYSGHEARNQMKALAKNATFSSNQGQPPIQIQSTAQCTWAAYSPWSGLSQPPRKKIEVRKLTRIMFAYSARKNSANCEPEYSTMWPATISASRSTTSNGARFVSATPDTKYTTNSGSSGNQNHSNGPAFPACAITISVRFRLPAAIS